MALHRARSARQADSEDVYTNALAQRANLPRYRIPAHPNDPHVVYHLLHDELALDGNAAQNLATFCTTWTDDQVRRLMDENISKNMIDKDEYPRTAAIEERCVSILANLWHAPDADETIGCSTTGSSEASMLAGLALKWRWRQARQAAGKPADRPNLVCGPVQVCWEKFARYFDVELRQVPLLPDATGLRPEQLRQYVDENTIGVVAILGVTYTCDYEPVKELADELDAIQRDTGLDVPLHVDGASGGFIAPFVQPEIEWDFRVPRVVSINSSGHKYGLAPLGVGWVVWRSAHLLPEELVFRVSYLGGDMPTFALNFSRPGGEVIAQYYTLLRLGHEGYTAVQQTCLDTAQYLADEIARTKLFTILYDGRGGLPAVSYTLAEDPGFSLYELSDQLRLHGWQVAAYPLPPQREETVIQRVMIRRGISRESVSLFAEDLRKSVATLQAKGRPATTGIGFHH